MKISIMLHTLIAIAVLVFIGGLGTGYVARGKPAAAPAVKAAVQHAAVAVAAAAKAETVFVHDVAKSTRWQTVYDTARVYDTVTVDHVVYVDRAIADSTIHACRGALSSCAIALAAKDTVIARKDSVIAAQDADRPSRLHSIVKDVVLVGLGYGAGRLNVRIPF